MNVNEAKMCPKCAATMRKARLLARENPIAHRDVVFEEAFQRKLMTEKKWLIAFAREECGFVETYVSETASLQ